MRRAPRTPSTVTPVGELRSEKFSARGVKQDDTSVFRHGVFLRLMFRSLLGDLADLKRARRARLFAHGIFRNQKCRCGHDAQRRVLGTGIRDGKPRPPVAAHCRHGAFNPYRAPLKSFWLRQ